MSGPLPSPASRPASRLLAVRPRIFRWPFLRTFFALLGLGLLAAFTGNGMMAVMGFGVTLGMWADAGRKYFEGDEELARALAPFHDGRMDEAEEALVAFLRVPRFEKVATCALVHLGLAAMRTLRFADAARIFELVVSTARRPDTMTARARAYLVIASLGADGVAAARTRLDAASRAVWSEESGTRAELVLARALVAFRDEGPARASSILAEKRPLLDNVLTGDDAALADALEMAVLAATSSGTSLSSFSVVIDRESRVFVLALVPECAPHIAHEHT